MLSTAILIFDEVEVLDFAGPFEVFSRARLVPGVESRRSYDAAPFNVFTVAKTRDPITATGRLRILPTHAFNDCPVVDLLVIPGGFGTRGLMHDEETLAWIRSAASQAQLTTSVCTGALLLAAAGLLKGSSATTHWGALDLLESLNTTCSAGVEVDRGRRLVDNGNIITSAGVSAGIDMAFHVVARLFGEDVARDTAKYIDYPRTTTQEISA